MGEFQSSQTNNYTTNSQTPLHISTSQKGLLNDRDTKTMFLGRLRLPKFTFGGDSPSPSSKFRRLADERDELSRSVPSTVHSLRERFNGVFKINWASLRENSKEWIKNPLNMALLFWITCVAVSGAILFLVMTGMLNAVLPKKSQRNAWFEVNNQILNALFTLMCLYQHPKRFYHLVLLCRWNPKDISQLRKIYCKNGTCKPQEWTHMMVVVVLLHINCVAQYALCGLNLGFKRSKRPAIGVGICLSIAITAPAIASLYSILSPLGREYDVEMDEEAPDQILTMGTTRPSNLKRKSLERRLSFTSKYSERVVENKPEWRGGLLDLWEDITLAYPSLFCSFCVFGWNMERLGFGNMYVHIATFILFCTAPFWIFNLAAINLDNETVREALGITGLVLCVFGLLYGGFWRIQMRKRFNLPANNSCCGYPALADCAQWLFCCWCSLAQEVRTADFYEIREDRFCRKMEEGVTMSQLSPLPREDGLHEFRSGPSSPFGNSPALSKFRTEDYPGSSRFSKDHSAFSSKGEDESMSPPFPSVIRRDDDDSDRRF